MQHVARCSLQATLVEIIANTYTMVHTVLYLSFCLLLVRWKNVEGFSSQRGVSKIATVPDTASFSSTFLSAMHRKDVLKHFISVPTIMIATYSRPAFADVTNKVASQAALRYMKRTISEFEKLEFYAAQNDYKEVKLGLRTPALSEVRKNANTLIKGGEDGPEAQNLVDAYSHFIKNLEALDSSSSLGVRGKKGVQLYSSYKQSLDDLNGFVAIAERSVQVPLQVVSETSVIE